MAIEVIDLFAGPGGLGEGFSAFTKKNKKPFSIKISIEKEKFAHQTLNLRSFYRQFKKVPSEYYQYLRGEISKENLFGKYPKEYKKSKAETYCAELGSKKFTHVEVMNRIRKQVRNPKNSIVIGGPPCQVYSLVGRTVMSKGKNFYRDPRHTLYKEYLKIIADIQPAAFIMENVKGILSAKRGNKHTFDLMLEDIKVPSKIKNPQKKIFKNKERYTIYSLSNDCAPEKLNRKNFVIKAEEYGIPQCRHRVILLAIRDDIDNLISAPSILKKSKELISVKDVLSDLPRVRSGLSKEKDTSNNWVKSIKKEFKNAVISKNLTRGDEFFATTGKKNKKPRALKQWFCDSKIGGVVNHSTRTHIVSDLFRYFFCASYASNHGVSPTLENFPSKLLPNHKNVKSAIKYRSLFNDRFRVQLADKPATTIISHISKDGHYFIHYDSKQCRSLTVREAARLQTFPDNYKFEGPRTSQYQQVGNAVPPLLALKIAKIVYESVYFGATDNK